ncbi:anhydro-N-acetylmuramic acid kinase [Mariprofundus ferrooxydans]|uniref:anhydro-N-acetylmuramic acid kinase n=1 Tax=Mariprofundus ferrooxydans TaxID=314344 RepID=UPI00142F9F4E|nr:anhydro-N-acetylmuramic acid kinase [Mariprofundus ferrooxydans]
MSPADTPLLLGIMSGTSGDGIDVAIVRFDRHADNKPELIRFSELPMPAQLREPILRLASPGEDANEIDSMGLLDRKLGEAYAEAALTAIKLAGLEPADIAAIGCHGQTIRHRPEGEYPFTLQIGCAATLAERTGITIVSDFRSRDMAAGGEGAPLVPFAHQSLFGITDGNVVVLNIGGIANITWLGADGSVTGFDTGPGNMVMDGVMLAITAGRNHYDQNGELAAGGIVCTPLLNKLMAHPYISRKPPKSTGREAFGDEIVQRILTWPEITDADKMATACRFTVESIAKSRGFLPGKPQRWLICGGGARNHHLMQQLTQVLAPAEVLPSDAAGMPSQAVEAASFAMLARATLTGEHNTLSAVTGASHDVCGGEITPGDNWTTLLQELPHWIR